VSNTVSLRRANCSPGGGGSDPKVSSPTSKVVMDASSQRKCRAPSRNTAASVFRKSLRGGGPPVRGRAEHEDLAARVHHGAVAVAEAEQAHGLSALYSPAASL